MSAEDRRFFVYARSGSKGPVYLTGPYDSKDRADPFVEPARAFAMKHDAWAIHYEFGVCSVPAREALNIKPTFADVPELSP